MFFSRRRVIRLVIVLVLLFSTIDSRVPWAHEKNLKTPSAAPHHSAAWRFKLPRGNVAAGRRVFAKYECHYCHRVAGESFPEPAESAPDLSRMGPLHPPEFFAESILHPDAVVPEKYRDSKGKSPMSRGHIDRMTLSELIDVAAYLSSLSPASGIRTAEGRVVALSPATGEMVLDHGPIPGFMDAMTMGYKVESPGLLKALRPGDLVRFTIDVEKHVINRVEKLSFESNRGSTQ